LGWTLTMFDADLTFDVELLPGQCEWLTEVEVHLSKEDVGSAEKLAESKLKDADPLVQASASYASAKIGLVQGKHAEARAAAEDALAKFRDQGSEAGEAVMLNTLAQIKLDAQGGALVEEALEQATDALTQFQKAQSGKGEAAALNTLAKVHYAKKDAEEALKQADLSHVSYKAIDDAVGEASALATKAAIFLLTGNFEYAAPVSEEAVARFKLVTTSAARVQEANALLLGSAAAASSGKPDEALKAAKSAQALFADLGGARGRAKSLKAVAFCQVSLGNTEQALKCADEAVALVEGHGDKQLRASVLGVAALAYRHKLASDPSPANEQKALNLVKEALSCYQEAGDERTAALTGVDLAHTLIECGNKSEALEEAKRAQEAFERLGEKVGEGIASLVIAELQYNMDQTAEAVDTAKKAQYLLSEFDGAKEADKLLAIMQAGTQQKSGGAISTWPTTPAAVYKEPPMQGGGVSKNLYSRLWSQAMHGPDRHEEIAYDAEGIKNMGNMLGVNMPFLVTWSMDQGGGGGAAPAAKPKKSATASLERQVEGPTEAEREEVAGALALRPPVVGGDDVLGGRAWDCPEELHNRMVALARRGDIPITKPAQREANARKRQTFHGSAQWREASLRGYIHPDLPAPAGTRWKKVAFGWKLIEEAAAAAELYAPPPTPPRAAARSSEPLGSMSLHAILQTACPGWTDREIIAARKKLGKIQIENTVALLEALRGETTEAVNARLKAAGEKGFKEDTLRALEEFCGKMR